MVRAQAGFAALAALLGGLIGTAAIRADEDGKLRDRALKLNEITGLSAMEGELKHLLKDEAGTKKLLGVVGKMVEEKPQPLNYNAAFVLARAAHNLKDFQHAQQLYKVCAEQAVSLQSADKLIQVYDGLIDLFYQNKKFDDAIKACREFLDIKPKGAESPVNRIKPFIMERMIQSMARKGKIDEALKLTDDLIEADEGGWYFLQLKGWVLREAGKLDEAAEQYQQALEKLKGNMNLDEKRRDRMSDGIRYLLSAIYVDAGKIDKAAEELQSLLKHHPNNPTYNNDLGFIWADHDMNLDESEKLIRKAIEEDRKQRKKDGNLAPESDKDNPAYLDSLGWVLFKKKDFKEAKKYLEEAIQQKDGQHIEILDHLADVHIALGEKADAIKVWKKALEQNAEQYTKREKERRSVVEKKLKEAEGK